MKSGYWPLYRFDPRLPATGKNPLQLDSRKPSIPLSDFYKTEARFSVLWRTHPDNAKKYLEAEQVAVHRRFNHLKQLSGLPVDDNSPATRTETGKEAS